VFAKDKDLINTRSQHSVPACPVCHCSNMEIFFTMPDVPVFCNLLWQEQQAARNCPKGDIQLAFCPQCGFITNAAFDPTRLEYTQDYENSLHCSPRFQDYARSLAMRLVKRHDLRDRDIIEIGCGKGDFLFMLCELGHNRGIGFDSSYVPQSHHTQAQVKFIQDSYSERYADYQADFICCRHVLEHVQNPEDLLKPLRTAIGDRLNTSVFFEVPNALHTFRRLAIWDIIYEHCSYFTPVSLARTFAACGFRADELTEEFDGQFLGLAATPVSQPIDVAKKLLREVEQLANNLDAFTTDFDRKIETWKSELKQMQRQGQRAVVWGTGSKGVTFLNLLGLHELVEYAIDINPRKQGMYVPGTGQQIVPPEFLQNYQPEVVLVMNPIYQSEIQLIMQNLGLNPAFMCV